MKLFRKNLSNRSVFFAIISLGIMVLIGVIGYMIIEDYEFIDALFMTIITISTVGFREIEPLSFDGKIFTIFLIIFSFGIFAYAISTLTKYLVDGVFRNFFKLNKVKRKIEKVKGHVVICGYGRNGRQATIESLEHGFDVLIIEQKEELVQRIIENSKLLFIQGNATQDEVLIQAQLENAKALITTLPNDADNLFVVLSAKDINPNLKIISRASDDSSDKKLKRAGATNVIMSAKIGGQRMAKLVAEPDVVEFLEHIIVQHKHDVCIEEICCEDIGQSYIGKSIRELGVRNASGSNIIGLRNKLGEYIINPTPDVILTKGDKLFVLGTPLQISKLKALLKD